MIWRDKGCTTKKCNKKKIYGSKCIRKLVSKKSTYSSNFGDYGTGLKNLSFVEFSLLVLNKYLPNLKFVSMMQYPNL